MKRTRVAVFGATALALLMLAVQAQTAEVQRKVIMKPELSPEQPVMLTCEQKLGLSKSQLQDLRVGEIFVRDPYCCLGPADRMNCLTSKTDRIFSNIHTLCLIKAASLKRGEPVFNEDAVEFCNTSSVASFEDIAQVEDGIKILLRTLREALKSILQ